MSTPPKHCPWSWDTNNRALTKCGALNVAFLAHSPETVTCKRCLKVMVAEVEASMAKETVHYATVRGTACGATARASPLQSQVTCKRCLGYLSFRGRIHK